MNHSVTRRSLSAIAAVLAFAPLAALAQEWPAKPIRLVVPFPAGGGTDIIAREVSGKLTASLKWNFVIENKPGSGGNLGVEAAVKSPADGYSLVIGQTSNLAVNATLYPKLPYDPVADLTPIGLIGNSALLFVVGANSPYRTLAEVVAAAKAKPDSLNYASAGNGTVGHLATELFAREAGIQLTHIPYKGAAQALTDVMSGQVQLYSGTVPTLIAHIKSGKLRPLAITASKRGDDLPQVPTVAESGYRGFEAVTWFGLLGPAKLPANLVTQMNAELNKALNAPDLRKKLEDQGLDVTPSTPDQFGRLIRADIAKWGRVVKESGAKAD